MPEQTQDAPIHRFGVFEVNLQSGELRKNGMRLRLSGQPFQVLAVLVERAGEVVTREELHGKLWQADTFVDFDHGLNNAVARIREVLDDSSGTPRYVETIPRRGYRFIAPLAPPLAALPPPATVLARADEPKISLPDEIASPAVTGTLDPPIRKRFAPTRLGVLLIGAAVIVALAAGLVLYRSSIQGKGRPAITSLAVLPLKNLSGDPTQEYLADGMTEELIARLAGIKHLRVISRTSVMRFKDTKLSTPEIAATLKVDALVEGSVIREGNKVRVQAQLIRAPADEHFWSETYDREMGDVLNLESEVAQSIAEKVEVTVTGQEQARLVAARHVSPEVYESYLKGRFGPHNTRTELEESITYLEKAIRKDPTFAPAYLGLASAYDNLGLIFVGGPPGEMRLKCIRAAQKALELDPGLAEAHLLLAGTYQKQWHWNDAEAEYKRALQLKPNYATAHQGFAIWLLCQGRIDEAVAWARRARELDPLGNAPIDLGYILFNDRRYDEAIRELRSVEAVHPDYAIARWYLGFALIGKGQPKEAILELERTASLMHRSPGSLALLSAAYAYAGRPMEALRLIDELKQRRKTTYVPAGAFIPPYLALRDYDQVFSWCERAYAEQSTILQFLKVDAFFDPVRGDPRFKDLVHRVGLQ